MRAKLLFAALSLCLSVGVAAAQDSVPAATIQNDEGGPVQISGALTYTNTLFTTGVGEPEIILEDQAGFVDRNRHFLIPVQSQVIGQITSDFYTSPFTYSLSLPEVPNGSYRDVDHDGEEDQGVQVFAIAYWENIWGDPYLEVRDLGGGGWSTAYASTRISPDPSRQGEVIGGKYVVYAADDQQEFPSGFGADDELFTDDDPLVRLPQGYTVVNMDAEPFTYDRARTQVIDLIEGEASQLDDYSSMGYADAFSAFVDQLREEYAFTEYKGIDWDTLEAEFLPRFQQADSDGDVAEYLRAIRDFSFRIPDRHVATNATSALSDDFTALFGGGVGIAIRPLDDGRVIVNYLVADSPAAQAGIQLRAEVKQWNGQPIAQAMAAVQPWVSLSTPEALAYQQARYVTRSPIGSDVTITYRNPGDTEDMTVTLTSVQENESFRASSTTAGSSATGFELPLEYHILDNGYAYVEIYSFSDNSRLTIELWERLMQTLNAAQVPGLIIDMRHNGGGSGWIADQMAAYFFEEELSLGNTAVYDKSKQDFYLDPNGAQHFYLPDEQFRYQGKVAVLVGQDCVSACEFFTYNMTLENRAAIVGMYPTAGGGGGVEDVMLPEGVIFRFPIARNLDPQGNIIIEGTGIAPTVKVPVDEQTLFAEGDPILDAAVAWLNEQT